ncbi:MAG: PepSY domain-containing protein [Oscillospiraceae bacterium]
MKRNEIVEEKLKKAVTNSTPDILEALLAKCEGNTVEEIKRDDKKGVVIDMKKPTNKNKWIQKVSAVAAAVAFIAIGGFSYLGYSGSSKVASVIDLDVNPSVEMKVNKAEKVVEIEALNKDAKIIVGDMDLKGVNLDVAVKALLGSMLENGYITDLQNSILVTVDNKNAKKGTDLEKKLVSEIDKILKSKSIDGCIISQLSNGTDQELLKLAQANNISTGKAKVISDIIKQNKNYKFEDLAKLSINELQLLVKDKGIKLENTVSQGNASNKAYIGVEAAKQIALKNCGLANAEKVLAHMDSENGKMVYEVEVVSGTVKYECDIDATSGSIITSKIDEEDNDVNDTDDAEDVNDADDADDDTDSSTPDDSDDDPDTDSVDTKDDDTDTDTDDDPDGSDAN